MAEERDGHRADRDNRALLAIARQFRDGASDAGRPDVVAKIDEAIILLAAEETPAGEVDGTRGRANVVMRILDGLGF